MTDHTMSTMAVQSTTASEASSAVISTVRNRSREPRNTASYTSSPWARRCPK